MHFIHVELTNEVSLHVKSLTLVQYEESRNISFVLVGTIQQRTSLAYS